MNDYAAVFERHEKKYLLTESQYNEVRAALAPRMEVDRYGLHTVSSLYFDTPSREIIRESIQKPPYKEKIRLRSYGVPGPHDNVFLELKKKIQGVVSKRRVTLLLTDAEQYIEDGVRPPIDGQIFEEIDWFMRAKKPQPSVNISCERLALFGHDDPDFRITFDFRIRWREESLCLSAGSGGSLLLPDSSCLMEVKTRNALPVWFAQLASRLCIYPTSFSKYGRCYLTHLIPKGELAHAG